MENTRAPSRMVFGMGWALSTTDGYRTPPVTVPRPDGSTRKVVEQFLDLAYRRGDLCAAFDCCVDERQFRGFQLGQSVGAKATRQLLLEQLAGTTSVEVRQLTVDADVGVAHLEFFDGMQRPIGQRVTAFRVRNGLIVEQWDSNG